jgi:DNA-binding PadR family transcriptional regulator
MTVTPLSTPLSQLLIAFTIELDNEFERRFAEAGGSARITSVVMWSNFLRFVGDGITAAELQEAAGLPKARVLLVLGGMERWRYVSLGSSTAKRNGYGSGRGVKAESVVRLTASGETAQELWPPLFGEIERRWEKRFGAQATKELRGALTAVADQLEVHLPEYLPIVVSSAGMRAEIPHAGRREPTPTRLHTLLAQVLLAYALDYERDSELSLPLAANVVRVLEDEASDVRELPSVAAVSPEAIAMALTALRKDGYVTQRAKDVQLTAKGREARAATATRHQALEREWDARFGRGTVKHLHAATHALLDQRDGTRARLALGLQPYPEGWRAGGKYATRTQAMLDDPLTGLARYPMVLPRGGWPDGS